MYYKEVIEKSKSSGSILFGRYGKIGWAYWQNGNKEDAEYWFNEQVKLSQTAIDKGRYYASSYDYNAGGQNAYYDLAGVYAFRGEKEKALEMLKVFDSCRVISFYMVESIKRNPMFISIRDDLEFKRIVKSWEEKYQAEHERVRKFLEEHKEYKNL
jgi:hypothetical protein